MYQELNEKMAEFFGKIKYYTYTAKEKNEIINRISEFFRRDRIVSLAYIYGSFIKRQQVQDMDICVLCKPEDTKTLSAFYPFSLGNKLETCIEPFRIEIDVKLLNEMPAWFRFNVLKSGFCIYESDPLTRIRFEKATMREYLDLKPQMEFYNRDMLRKIQNG